MLVKFGSIITSGSGSLGGHTIQNSKGGAQLRTKPINKKQPSIAQQLVRSYNPQMQQGWRDLTDAQRVSWNIFPINNNIYNSSGEKYYLSGHSLWMSYQFKFISNGLPFDTNVGTAGNLPFGPNILLNGGFDNSDNWSTQSQWSIAGGKASYTSVSNSLLIQNGISLTQGVEYNFTVDVLDLVSGTANFQMRNQLNQQFVQAGQFSLVNGTFSLDFTCLFDTTSLRFFGLSSSFSAYSIDNIFLRLKL